MQITTTFTAGIPQLDIHTLSEDWLLAMGVENHWQLVAESLGLPPSRWFDNRGDRMYAAIIMAVTGFDLQDPIREDDEVSAETRFQAIRKPHSMSLTEFRVKGVTKATATFVSTLIKRDQKGSNKKFSKVRGVWTAEDFNEDAINARLEEHFEMKDHPDAGAVAQEYEISRIQDFNTADFMYFKNFVRIAKAAEWRENRGRPTRLNAERTCYFYGNVEDGQIVTSRVARDGDAVQTTHHADDGRRIFLSLARAPEVEIAVR